MKPFSTIIMMQESETIPFDLNHCRILTYKNFDKKLDDAENTKEKLRLLIENSKNKEKGVDYSSAR